MHGHGQAAPPSPSTVSLGTMDTPVDRQPTKEHGMRDVLKVAAIIVAVIFAAYVVVRFIDLKLAGVL